MNASANASAAVPALSPSRSFLQHVLTADALFSGVAGLTLVLGSQKLGAWLGFHPGLLLGAGLVLLPFSAGVAWTARAHPPQRGAVWAIVVLNLLWVGVSALLLMVPLAEPGVAGMVFVLAQAAAVAVLAGLQTRELRRH